MASIMVVDDEASIRQFMVTLLERKGHDVVAVPDFSQGLSVLSKRSLDLIILDLNVAHENGIAFLKELRSHQTKIPILIYSGAIDPETEKKAREAGASDVLYKSCSVVVIEEHIQKILKASGRPIEAKAASLLIVDDEESVRTLIAQFFMRNKFHVLEASSGAEALKIIEEKKPLVVLLDMRMPEMDGLETLKKIRVLDPLAGVIMISGHDDPDLVHKAMSLGALGYILKPFDFVYLELVVLSKLLIASQR